MSGSGSGLAAGPILFDLLVQRRTMPDSEPLDDAAKAWKSPLVKAGTLHIPPQDFETEERLELEERISYSPYNALKEHELLGSPQRGAAMVISSLRSEPRGLVPVPRAGGVTRHSWWANRRPSLPLRSLPVTHPRLSASAGTARQAQRERAVPR